MTIEASRGPAAPFVAYAAAVRRRQAAARSAPHWRQRQRVPRSAGTRLSGVSSWPLPQRLGGKTVRWARFGPKSGNIEQVQSTPPLALSSLAIFLMAERAKLRTQVRLVEGSSPGPLTFSPSLDPRSLAR